MEPSTPLGLAYDLNPLCSSRDLIDDSKWRTKLKEKLLFGHYLELP